MPAPNINALIYQALMGQQSQGTFNPQSLLTGLSAFRGAPAQSAPIPQPGNLSSIFAGAGPYMQQALALAGQQRPVHAPPPQQGSTWNPPPGVHVAPPYTNPYMGEQWLGALSGIGM